MPKKYKTPKLNLGYLKKAEKAAEGRMSDKDKEAYKASNSKKNSKLGVELEEGDYSSKKIYGKDKNLFKQISKRYKTKIRMKPRKKKRMSDLDRQRAKTDSLGKELLERERIKREKKIKLRIKGMK